MAQSGSKKFQPAKLLDLNQSVFPIECQVDEYKGVRMSDDASTEPSMIKLIEGAEQAFLSGRRRKQADVESAVGIFLDFAARV